MSNATDMSTPVTRGELREELKKLATKADLEKFATKADLEKFATKADLEQLATKIDLKIDLWGGALLDRLEKKLTEELARHAKAHHESTLSMISAIDEKYKDLPERMKRVEATLFPTEQR